MNLTTKTITFLISVFAANAASPANPAGPTTLRTHDDLQNSVVFYDSAKTAAVPNRVAVQSITAFRMPADTICNLGSRVQYGQPAPRTGGGTLGTVAPYFDTTMNSSGQVAFGSPVDGSSRNQGFFVSNPDGTESAIAIGCGDFGGGGDTTSLCGDPSPIGGKISGLFFYTPSINDAGDVVFISDVNGGSARRALFVYHAATRTLEKVAAPGDPSPVGGVFDSVSPGTISNSGKVFFLALPAPGSFDSDLFMWENGVVTKVAATGDPAPGGGTYSIIGSQSVGYVDGTTMPIGPLPDINDSDEITFRAIVSGGITDRGIIVRKNGVDHWYVKVPDPTPIGGTYLSMEAPSINNAGQVSFFADYHPTPTTTNSGWFAGAPGNWRKVLVFGDSVDGGEVFGLAVSNNPEQEIDAAGNVFVWANLDSNGNEDRLLLNLTGGELLVVARNGDPTPIGGTFNGLSPWPTMNQQDGIFGAYTPGAQHFVLNAYFTFERCSDNELQLTSAASKKGPFEIDLPLTGPPGVECRSGGPGGEFTVIFTFNNVLSSVDGASTTCGTVSSMSINTTDPHRLFVSLTGASCNEEYVTVTVSGLQDDQGNTLTSAAATMGMLIADTNGDRTVDAADVSQVRSDRGEQTDSTNFHQDINVSGAITRTDVNLARAAVGTMLPP